ncbi:hypothetical protein OAH41_04605 [Paracoccaceae bacterium]|nr:hypothetical protein [Paracoccaceae bacterium]
MRKFLCLSLIGALVLTISCSSSEDRKARKEAEEAALEKSFVRACLEYGHLKNTPDYRQCVSSERRIKKAEITAQRALEEAEWADHNAMVDCTINGGSYGGGTCFGRN